jgi:hypothetical protein
MKTLFTLILVVAVGVAVGVATASLRLVWNPWDGNPPVIQGQAPVAPASESLQPAPKLVIDHLEFDFGKLDIDEEGSRVFHVRNAGNAPLTIAKGVTSCRCAVSELKQTEIPPGESGEITIKWKARERPGSYRETASFSTNDPFQPQFTLAITGKITAKFWISPAELLFNQISADQPATRQARLLCYQDQSWEVLEHQWENAQTAEYFQFALQPLTAAQLREEPAAKSGYLVTVTVKPGLPSGAFQQKIRLKTNLPFRPEITIPIYGSLAGEISVVGPGWDAERGVLNLGIVNPQQGIKRRLLLIVRGASRKEVKFKPLENPALPIKVSLGKTTEINNGLLTQTPLLIEIPKGSRPANHLGNKPSDWGEITIETTHPELSKVRVLVQFAVEG